MNPVNKDHTFSSQEELWNAFKRGDSRAYEKMFSTHYKQMYNYGLKIHRDEEEVKDCIQQLFFEMWRSRERLGPNSSIKSYLLASLRRMILRKIKASRIHSYIEDVDASFHAESSAEYKNISSEEERARVELLTTLLNKLPDRQKEALYLRFYGDQSFDEIAEVMGITTRAVYKLVYKALDNLAAELAVKNIKLHHLFSFLFL